MSNLTDGLERIQKERWYVFERDYILPMGNVDLQYFHNATRVLLLELQLSGRYTGAHPLGMAYAGVFCVVLEELSAGYGLNMTAIEVANMASKLGIRTVPLENLRQALKEIGHVG